MVEATKERPFKLSHHHAGVTSRDLACLLSRPVVSHGMTSFLLQMAPTGRLLRRFASQAPSFTAPGTGVYRVFDREAKRLQRDVAARREGGQRSRTVDYLRDEVADRLMERLSVRPLLGLSSTQLIVAQDIKRKFNTIVDLGAGPGHFSKLLEPDKTRKVVMIELSS